MARIEKVLSDSEMLESQRKTLEAFDRFNELECQCRLSPRLGYILAVRSLELSIRKLFKEIKKGRLAYLSQLKQNHTISCVKTFQTLLKRFLRWLEMVETDEALPDEEKVERADVLLPHDVEWIKEFHYARSWHDALLIEAGVLRLSICSSSFVVRVNGKCISCGFGFNLVSFQNLNLKSDLEFFPSSFFIDYSPHAGQ